MEIFIDGSVSAMEACRRDEASGSCWVRCSCFMGFWISCKELYICHIDCWLVAWIEELKFWFVGRSIEMERGKKAVLWRGFTLLWNAVLFDYFLSGAW